MTTDGKETAPVSAKTPGAATRKCAVKRYHHRGHVVHEHRDADGGLMVSIRFTNGRMWSCHGENPAKLRAAAEREIEASIELDEYVATHGLPVDPEADMQRHLAHGEMSL